MIRMVDLEALHRPIQGELDRATRRVMEHKRFIGGPEVEEFERAFAAWTGYRHCVAVNSVTVALMLGILALELPKGATVATVANAAIATVDAIVGAGCQLAWVDVEPATGLMNPHSLARVLEHEKVQLVLPVHFSGAPAPLPAIHALAMQHGAQVAVDACQALGTRVATLQGLMPAGWGARWAVYSFYPSENLGALGAGGAIVTDDDEIAHRVHLLGHHGQARQNESLRPCFSEGMDTVQAAWLMAKLPHLSSWTRRRRELASLYDRLLPAAIRLRHELYGESVFRLYPVRVGRPDHIQAALAVQGIESDVYRPHPACSLLAGHQPNLPATRDLLSRVLSLPLHPHLTEDDVQYVAGYLLEELAKA